MTIVADARVLPEDARPRRRRGCKPLFADRLRRPRLAAGPRRRASDQEGCQRGSRPHDRATGVPRRGARASPTTRWRRAPRRSTSPTPFPRDLVARAGALGLMGVTIPEAWGGRGLDYVGYALALEDCRGASATVAVILAVNNSLVAEPLARVRHRGAEGSAGCGRSRAARRSAPSRSRRSTPAPTPPTSRRASRTTAAASA